MVATAKSSFRRNKALGVVQEAVAFLHESMLQDSFLFAKDNHRKNWNRLYSRLNRITTLLDATNEYHDFDGCLEALDTVSGLLSEVATGGVYKTRFYATEVCREIVGAVREVLEG